MQFSKFKLLNLLSDIQFRYLAVGVWNTIFGYGLGVFLFALMNKNFHIVIIGIIANVIGITMSFFTYKKFVFKTEGSWVKAYLRCYFSYGLNAILSIFLLWLFVDVINLSIFRFSHKFIRFLIYLLLNLTNQ